MCGMDSHGALPDNLTAVVIDTNAMPEGRLDLGQLRTLPTVLSNFPDVEIWIPEPVLWEWASHAQQDYDDAVAATNPAVRRLKRAEVQTQLRQVAEADRHDVRATVISTVSALPRPFRVVRLGDYPDAAVEAIRRQVLQLPPAKRKSLVKTGAADTAVLLLAGEVYGELGGEYVIVSDDLDIRKHADPSNAPWLRVFRSFRDLRNAALAFQPIELRLVPKVFRLVQDHLDQIRSGIAPLGEVRSNGLVTEALGDDADWLTVEVEVTWIDRIAVLRHVEIDVDARVGTAEVVVIAVTEVTGWRMDAAGEELDSETGAGYTARLDLAVTFTLDSDNVDIQPVSAAPFDDGYPSADAALAALTQAAAEIPGFDALVDRRQPTLGAQQPTWSGEINSRTVTITYQPCPSGDADEPSRPRDVWRLFADTGGHHLEVLCRAELTWTGPGTFTPQHRLVADDPQATYALSRFLLEHIYDAVDNPEPADRLGPHA